MQLRCNFEKTSKQGKSGGVGHSSRIGDSKADMQVPPYSMHVEERSSTRFITTQICVQHKACEHDVAR